MQLFFYYIQFFNFYRDVSKPNSYNIARANKTTIEGPYDVLAWLMTRSFGISLVYPGSMSLMKMMIERALLEGRTKLVMENNGERSKVVTGDGNQIDTMFVDMRHKWVLWILLILSINFFLI